MYLFKKIIFFLFLCLCSSYLFAQHTITGSVKNEAGENLPSASVILVNENSTVIGYAITDVNGNFKLNIPIVKALPALWLEASYIGFKKEKLQLSPQQQLYNFKLSPDAKMLNEVVVKNRPLISSSGDTLKYNVLSFAQKEDRSIADVLRRMPGIDIMADGTIYFNGKEIENLYIHGDDLMNGRYGLASKVIRKEMIESVDVIKNHQPIKVLQDKVYSDKTAINLVLKDENALKISAKATVMAGLPHQYNLEVTPILLNKRIKMINTMAANNAGIDYKNDFKQLGSANLISNINNKGSQIDLSLGAIGPPDLPLSNYYLNHSAVINLNNLYNTKKGLQFKVNVQGFIDKNSLTYSSYSKYYTANDTTTYTERQTVYNKPMLLNTSFNLMINKKQYFFNDNIQINFGNERDSSFMNFNNYAFPEYLKKYAAAISNDINWIPALKGKGVGEVRWLLKYTKNKQLLNIGQGYYSDITGNQGYYDTVQQQTYTPALLSNLSFAYKITSNKLNQEYKFGFITEGQRLTSLLNFIDNGFYEPYTGDSGNDLNWLKNNVYISPEFQVKGQRLKSTIQLPVTYQYIHYKDQAYNLNSKQGVITFNPLLKFNYDFNPEERLFVTYKFNKIFGDITDVYRGAVMQNYRTLQANDADVQNKDLHSVGLYYNFQRSINMLFINAEVIYDNTKSNTILSTETTDNIQKLIMLPYKNTQHDFTLNTGISKYMFGLKSNISVKARWKKARFEQLLNDALVPYAGDNFSLTGSLNKKIFQAVSVTYASSFLWNYARLKEEKNAAEGLSYSLFRLYQDFAIGFSAFKRLYFEINSKYSYYKQSANDEAAGYFFLNQRIRYTNKLKKIDLSLNVTNLFNVKDYTEYFSAYNQLSYRSFDIRGRMVTLSFEYYF